MLDESATKHLLKTLFVSALDVVINPEEIADDEPLWDELDSIATVELLMTIENHFNIQIPDTEIRPELFESINSLYRVVSKYLPRWGQYSAGV